MARLKLFIPLLIFLVLAGFLLRGLSIDPKELPTALKDRPFPAFELPALAPAKRILGVADLKGPALVNVWATWCPSCRVEHGQLLAIAAEGVPVYGVNYKDERSAALAWLEQLGDPYRFNIFDPEGSLGMDLGVYGAPETYVIDAEGVIRYKRVGVVTEELWRDTIRPMIRAMAAESGT